MKLVIKMIIAITIVGILVIGACNLRIYLTARGKTRDRVEDVTPKDVAVVLGTSKYSIKGGINKYYKNRIDATYELYVNKKVKFILVSGDNALREYNEPINMKRSLVERGIPSNVIYLDYAGFSTLDSIIRAKKVFGLNSFILVSQKFHNERGIYIGNNNDLYIEGYNAKSIYGRRVILREILARVKAVLDIEVLNTKPKFLGERVYIGKETMVEK